MALVWAIIAAVLAILCTVTTATSIIAIGTYSLAAILGSALFMLFFFGPPAFVSVAIATVFFLSPPNKQSPKLRDIVLKPFRRQKEKQMEQRGLTLMTEYQYKKLKSIR